MKVVIPDHIKKTLEEASQNEVGVKFDIGCGDIQQEGFIGIDRVPSSYVDICLDLEKTPYPFPDGCASLLMAGQIVEHLKPWLLVDIMNEWWRITKIGGQLMIATPYAGSELFWADPTHTKGWNELTPKYFDPLDLHMGDFWYKVYKPKPWKVKKNTWEMSGMMEILLEKIPDDPSYHKLDLRPKFFNK